MEIQQRIEVQGSRIEYIVYCDWCAGHGYEPTTFGDVVDCDKCHGSCFQFHHVMEDDDG